MLTSTKSMVRIFHFTEFLSALPTAGMILVGWIPDRHLRRRHGEIMRCATEEICNWRILPWHVDVFLCLCHCIWLHRSHWSSPLSEKANADKLRLPSYRGSWKILKASSMTCQVTSDINVHCFGAAARAARCELKDLSCKNECTRKPLLLVVPLVYEFRASPPVPTFDNCGCNYLWTHIIRDHRLSIYCCLVRDTCNLTSGCRRSCVLDQVSANEFSETWTGRPITAHIFTKFTTFHVSVCHDFHIFHISDTVIVSCVHLPFLEWSQGSQELPGMQHHGPSVSYHSQSYAQLT